MKKVFKWFLRLFFMFIILFAGFISGVIFSFRFREKNDKYSNALFAQEIMRCTENLRKGGTEFVIEDFDSISANLLFLSAYDKERLEMKELPGNILSVWQDAAIYYEKFDIKGHEGNRVSLVKEKLEYVPFSEQETMRRQFEIKYKGLTRQLVPELEIIEWYGEATSLAEQRGNVVLLDFGPHLKGLPKLQQLYKTHKDKGLAVIALTCPDDYNEKVLEIINENNYTFNVAKAEKSVIKEYAVTHIPSYYLIDKQGRFVWGPMQDIPIELIETLLNEPATVDNEDNPEAIK